MNGGRGRSGKKSASGASIGEDTRQETQETQVGGGGRCEDGGVVGMLCARNAGREMRRDVTTRPAYRMRVAVDHVMPAPHDPGDGGGGGARPEAGKRGGGKRRRVGEGTMRRVDFPAGGSRPPDV